MPKVLIVEDDISLSKRLRKHLESENYTVETAAVGKDALQLLECFAFDVIVLDWELPDVTGLELCRKFKSSGGTTPILFLTGRDAVDDKISGLDSGAEDYLVKPFDGSELSARLRSLLRRPPDTSPTKLERQNVIFEVELRTVRFEEREVRLTTGEGAILEYLMRNVNQTAPAKTLREKIWSADDEVAIGTVHTLMNTLRQKLKRLGCEHLIKTVANAGYVVES